MSVEILMASGRAMRAVEVRAFEGNLSVWSSGPQYDRGASSFVPREPDVVLAAGSWIAYRPAPPAA